MSCAECSREASNELRETQFCKKVHKSCTGEASCELPLTQVYESCTGEASCELPNTQKYRLREAGCELRMAKGTNSSCGTAHLVDVDQSNIPRELSSSSDQAILTNTDFKMSRTFPIGYFTAPSSTKFRRANKIQVRTGVIPCVSGPIQFTVTNNSKQRLQ